LLLIVFVLVLSIRIFVILIFIGVEEFIDLLERGENSLFASLLEGNRSGNKCLG
jgi:hypothetical protein